MRRPLIVATLLLWLVVDLTYLLFPNADYIHGAAVGLMTISLPVAVLLKPKYGLLSILFGIGASLLQGAFVVLVNVFLRTV